MHRFAGDDAALYDIGEPFETVVPLEDTGDGFTWRAADAALSCWHDGIVFSVWETARWSPVEPEAVCLVGGVVEFARCLRGQRLAAFGLVYPASLLATSDAWRLEQKVIVGKGALGGAGGTVSSGGAHARLEQVREQSWEGVAVVRRVLAVLRSDPAGAFVGLGELVRDAFGVTVMFDNQGVTYAPR